MHGPETIAPGSDPPLVGKPPRVLRVDLGQLAPGGELRAEPEPFADPDGALEALAALGGSALALALLAQGERRGPAARQIFALAVGPAVERGLPTAARVSLAARSPLTGGLAEGLAGGDLGPRLASLASGLVLQGRAGGAGPGVLVLEPRGAEVVCRLLSNPDWPGLSPAELGAGLEARLGPAGLALVGPAALDPPLGGALPFANLAVGGSRPSFTGRGGLGRALARHGLLGIAVCAPAPAPRLGPAERELLAALSASPRLRARSEGGTLELWHAAAARGDLPGRAERLADEAARAARERHGCRGCPTPCGVVFDAGGGPKRAHFGATQALARAVGAQSLETLLGVLETCDRWGVDALEAGAVLELEAGGEPLTQARAAGRIEELARFGETAGVAARGAAALSAELGRPTTLARGRAARAETGFAARLARLAAAGGTDPLRAFPALIEGAEPDELARLAPGHEWSEADGRPERPEGKGRLLWWFENLAAAGDATGFCAFSAAGLLADGLADLDRLARWTAPGIEDGAAYARAGARVAFWRAALDLWRGGREGHGAGWSPGEGDGPEASDARDLAEQWAHYRELRGLEVSSAAGLGAVGAARAGRERAPGSPVARAEPAPAALGIGAQGPLAQALGLAPGGVLEFTCPLPCTLEELLRRLAAAHPGAAEMLLDPGARPRPSAWRAGRRLLAGDSVSAGERIELVLALSGG